MLTKSLQIRKATEAQKAERRRTFVASTDTIDRDGDIIEQDWVLDDFLNNPVILFAHKSRELPIGKAENVGVVDGRLQMDIVFASEKANPLAEQVYQSVVEETLRAVSVGFLPGDVRREMRDSKDIYVFSKNLLLETSVTPVPSNPEALARCKALATKGSEPEDEAKNVTLTPPREQEESAGGGKEQVMDEKEAEKVRKDLEEARVKIAKIEGERDAAVAKLAEATKALDEQKARADAAVRQNVERQIDALVGKKITPAEKPGLIKLAELSPDLFAEQMKALGSRADLGILQDGSRLPEPPPTTPVSTADEIGGHSFDELVQRAI